MPISTKHERTLSLQRLRAVAILRFGTVDALYRRLPVCPRAIQYQISRGRLSDAVKAAFVAELGPDDWRFVIRESHILSAEGETDAPA